MPEAMEIEPAPAAVADVAPAADSAEIYRADMKAVQSSVERFVSSRESRFATGALKLMACLRNAGRTSPAPTQPVLAAAVAAAFSPSHPLRERLLAALPAPAAEPEPVAAADAAKSSDAGESNKKRPLLPELELLLEVLVLLSLIDGALPTRSAPYYTSHPAASPHRRNQGLLFHRRHDGLGAP